MLSNEEALKYYKRIVSNDRSGDYTQKVLALRLILDNVLHELFPNISDQAIYRVRINQIFETKISHGTFPINEKQWEFHQLRIYLNNVMHSKIIANKEGYITSVRRLSSLINFCSEIEIPAEIISIYTDTDFKLPNSKATDYSEDGITRSKYTSNQTISPSPILCIVVDRRHDFSNTILREIGNGIKTVVETTLDVNFTFIVFTIKTDSSILAFPSSQKKIRFSFNNPTYEELIQPLKDYLVNLNPETQYHFVLTKASLDLDCRVPISLNDSSLLMSIGIVENANNKNFRSSHALPNFDKLILDYNLPSFFDWISKTMNNI